MPRARVLQSFVAILGSLTIMVLTAGSIAGASVDASGIFLEGRLFNSGGNGVSNLAVADNIGQTVAGEIGGDGGVRVEACMDHVLFPTGLFGAERGAGERIGARGGAVRWPVADVFLV